jgi:signal transduction histidine kinase
LTSINRRGERREEDGIEMKTPPLSTSEFARVARLYAMGVATASMAHEINQPLGAILVNAEAGELLLAKGGDQSARLREVLAEIREQSMRASQVVRSLHGLLCRHEMRSERLDVTAETTHALREVARNAALRTVRIVTDLAGDVPDVIGDSVQIRQVVINLATNAIDAASAAPEGEREVRVETHAKDGSAQIRVSDTGPGVSPEHRDRIFEAFFTTKPDGMGLGLSIVRTIVEAHGGRICLEPAASRGSAFCVWLPTTRT